VPPVVLPAEPLTESCGASVIAGHPNPSAQRRWRVVASSAVEGSDITGDKNS